MQLPVTDVSDNGSMEAQEPSIKMTDDDTPIAPARAGVDGVEPGDSDDVQPHESGGGEPADDVGPSIELAIEALAGLDPAEAPDLADDIAARLRANLSER